MALQSLQISRASGFSICYDHPTVSAAVDEAFSDMQDGGLQTIMTRAVAVYLDGLTHSDELNASKLIDDFGQEEESRRI